MTQIAQTMNRPFLQGEELNSFREAQLPVDRALRSRFGTSDTEELKRQGISSVMVLTAIVEEFSKLDRAVGGAGNALDNLQDAIKMAGVGIGSGLGILGTGIAAVTTSVEELTDSGVMKLFGQELSRMTQEIAAAFSGAGGGRGLTDVILEFGGAMVDVAQIISTLTKWLAFIPGMGVGRSILGGLAGGAGAVCVRIARAKMILAGAVAGSGIGEETVSAAGTPTPVQAKMIRVQEEIARNTAELVRFEQQAFGGGNLLAMGINAADANRFNGDGRTGGTTRAKSMLIDAVEAMIATQLARAAR